MDDHLPGLGQHPHRCSAVAARFGKRPLTDQPCITNGHSENERASHLGWIWNERPSNLPAHRAAVVIFARFKPGHASDDLRVPAIYRHDGAGRGWGDPIHR